MSYQRELGIIRGGRAVGKWTTGVSLAVGAYALTVQACSNGGDGEASALGGAGGVSGASSIGGAAGSRPGSVGGTAGSGPSTCDRYCDFDPGLGCENEIPRVDCMASCNVDYSRCPTETEAFTDCMVIQPPSSFECTDIGFGWVSGACNDQQEAIELCLINGSGGAPPGETFICDDGATELSADDVCDGVENCSDGADEADCP